MDSAARFRLLSMLWWVTVAELALLIGLAIWAIPNHSSDVMWGLLLGFAIGWVASALVATRMVMLLRSMLIGLLEAERRPTEGSAEEKAERQRLLDRMEQVVTDYPGSIDALGKIAVPLAVALCAFCGAIVVAILKS
jgi:hypothetical protein